MGRKVWGMEDAMQLRNGPSLGVPSRWVGGGGTLEGWPLSSEAGVIPLTKHGWKTPQAAMGECSQP